MPTRWFRVFGTTGAEPDPAALLEFLQGLGSRVEGHFQADDQGWYRAQFLIDGTDFQAERYLASEEGIRAELNTWAAWVESTEDGTRQTELMQQIIAAQQVIVLRNPQPEYGATFCRYLAQLTAGIYQIDGLGFFNTEGTLLLSEEAASNQS